WMGGVPPLGYRLQDRKLVIIDSKAEIVRSVFRRYAELGSVRLLKAELEAQGRKSKSWTSAAGRVIGGKPFSRGALVSRSVNGEVVILVSILMSVSSLATYWEQATKPTRGLTDSVLEKLRA